MERDAGLEAPDGGESEKVIGGYSQQLRLLEDRLQAPGGVGEGLGVEEEGQLDGQLVDGLQAQLSLEELAVEATQPGPVLQSAHQSTPSLLSQAPLVLVDGIEKQERVEEGEYQDETLHDDLLGSRGNVVLLQDDAGVL